MTGWHERAACAGADPALFDPVHVEANDVRLQRLTKAVAFCERCTVADTCLQEARTYRDSGVRGGVLLEDGRPIATPLRGREPVQPHGTYAAYKRHVRAHTPACPSCRAAHARYTAQFRTRRGVA